MKDNNLRTIAQKYGITLIYLFGSEADKGKKYLEGEEVIPDAFSDLDVAIAFETPPVDAIRTYGFLYREISERFDPFNVDLIFMHEVNTLFQYADNFEETIMKKSEELFYKKRVLHNEIMEAIEDGYFEFEYSPAP
ncbi:MAG: nucleotidyltransferase domain-containing protein [Nitrospirota bacterium]|nr:nucleotidyltransferase domain-containing protein [Nitrospirota bacterium]